MANFNRVILMGNLTRDPELRYTPSGSAVCEFGLAMNRSYKTSSGEQRDETCFVDVTMWGRRGEVISEYFTKGRPILIEGRLKFDSWESAEGRRSKLVVVAENFEFVGSRQDGGGGGRRQDGGDGGRQGGGSPRRDDGARPDERRDEAPRERKQPPREEPADEGFDVSDDEIPF